MRCTASGGLSSRDELWNEAYEAGRDAEAREHDEAQPVPPKYVLDQLRIATDAWCTAQPSDFFVRDAVAWLDSLEANRDGSTQ